MAALIERFDRDWSRFRDDSLVAEVARRPGSYRMPPEAGPLLSWYRELYAATGGRVSPLVGRALEALGYGAGYRLRPAAEVAPVPAWDDVLDWDGEHLETRAPVVLDIGAAGKGLLVDLVSRLLMVLGSTRHVVDASGDLVTAGTPMRIALENPANPAKAVGIAELRDGAFCASAGNRRAWAGVHHILDAVTGMPAPSVIGTWAIAPTAMVADGAATALFFDVDPDLLSRHDIRFARMFADGRLERSTDFPGEVFG